MHESWILIHGMSAKKVQIWVEIKFWVKCTMWKSTLQATVKGLNCWNRTFETKVIANWMWNSMSSDLYNQRQSTYTTCQVWLAVTSVWKVHFQQFEHYSVANSKLFQMVCSKQKFVSTQNVWIMDIKLIHGTSAKKVQIWVRKILELSIPCERAHWKLLEKV